MGVGVQSILIYDPPMETKQPWVISYLYKRGIKDEACIWGADSSGLIAKK